MTVFLALIIVALVLGLIGATADGLFYLLLIGIVVLVVDVVYLVVRMRRSPPRRVR
ncbi:hypothetical protein [Streptomyces sp. NPDC091371]|uniref:hypothetical protein n=1 Tax=Streptomyces sp. NPDC091371 TaxID=3155303 RepID=UPI003436778D